MSSCCFAVIPDDGIVDQQTPVALFASIEDAMDWALSRYKGGSFRLRYEPVAVIERDTARSS